jgi:hypothetical protein
MGELGRRGSVPVRPEEAHKKPYSAPQLIPRLDALRENRRDLRFRLDVEVKIHSPSMGPVPGQTLDISERGLSALLPVELPLEEVVEVNLKLHIGRVNVRATIRNRNAFRHGFQFVEPNPALHLIRENCCFLEQIPTLNSAMEAEPEEKTLENGVRLRLYRGRQWTVGNQRLTGDGLEVSEPPDHLPDRYLFLQMYWTVQGQSRRTKSKWFLLARHRQLILALSSLGWIASSVERTKRDT